MVFILAIYQRFLLLLWDTAKMSGDTWSRHEAKPLHLVTYVPQPIFEILPEPSKADYNNTAKLCSQYRSAIWIEKQCIKMKNV